MPLPRIVIIGGGFAGLAAAQSLARAPVSVTLIDRRNHHLFQPMLYQVATASLSPAEIAAPIRKVLSRQQNATVLLGDAVAIDTARQEVVLKDGRVGFDYLILACGVTHSYFGHNEWAPLAPGLKTIEDATEIRRRFLLAFEAAERETDEAARRAKLTFVVVGAGPTGVELAGAMAEIARRSIPRDFRSIDTRTARIILVEGADRVLTAFPPELSARAKRDLEHLGVEVRLSSRVTEVDAGGVRLGDERIAAECVLWAAGVQAEPIAATLGVELDRSGRVKVGPDLSIPAHPRIFVAGDLATITDPRTGQPVPGVCPAALQMGKHVAAVIAKEITAPDGPVTRRVPFRYRDKGILATIGRARAVADIRGLRFAGLLAWLLWAGVHIFFLITFRNRVIVMLQWAWEYLLFQRGARLITGKADLELASLPARSDP
jgi:NADH dehydrogenase